VKPFALSAGRAWLLLCAAWALACIGVSLLPDAAQHALRWQGAPWWHRPWTLWTASLVHLSAAHLWGNLLALAALAGLGHVLHMPRYAVAALLVAWPLATLGLAAWPQVEHYSGFSGLNHAIAQVLIAQAAIKFIAGDRLSLMEKILALVLLSDLVVKLAMETAWNTPMVWSADWGFAVVRIAHLLGAASGLVATLLCYALARIFFTMAVVE
jgi:membrane associated rhomboid family serine protease